MGEALRILATDKELIATVKAATSSERLAVIRRGACGSSAGRRAVQRAGADPRPALLEAMIECFGVCRCIS